LKQAQLIYLRFSNYFE